MITVAIVSPFRFRQSVNEVITNHDFGCAFRTFEYNHLTDIDRICEECREKCDVILFSGELGYHYMKTYHQDYPVPCGFTVYGIADVLSILLSFHIRHPEIPLNRVYLDFLTPMNDYLHIQDYLPPEQLPYFFEEGNYDYTNITEQASRLWQAGKIDFVISRSINNLKAWEHRGIPFEAVYPTEQMLRKSIEEAVNRERLKSISDRNVVTLIVHLPGEESDSHMEREYRLATLFKYLVDYRKKTELDYSIQQGFDRFVCRSSVAGSSMDSINFHEIILLFQKYLDFPFSVGIGIHPNEQTSQYHAERALLESNRYGLNEGFLVSGEPEVMTGPLGKTQTIRYSYQEVNLTQFAHKLGIGNANLLRLVGLYRKEPNIVLTAVSLGPLLGITLRSTRRILQKLCDMGIVVPAAGAEPAGRGRPTHRYIFVPEAMEKAMNAETEG